MVGSAAGNVGYSFRIKVLRVYCIIFTIHYQCDSLTSGIFILSRSSFYSEYFFVLLMFILIDIPPRVYGITMHILGFMLLSCAGLNSEVLYYVR